MLNSLETFGMTMRELINELEDNYPSFIPHPSETDRMIMYKAGQRSVVEWITSRLAE
jgi:hypothetical protein